MSARSKVACAVRVALVTAGGFDDRGKDVTPALLWLVERLARRHEVAVYVLRYLERPSRYEMCGATIHDLGRPDGLWRQYRRLACRVAQHGRPDVVHGYMALPAGVVAAALGRRLGVPAIVTCDSGEFAAIPDIRYGLQLRFRHRLAVAAAGWLATKVTVCSEYQRGLARAHGLEPDLVPFGVDARLFGPSSRSEGPPWRLVHVASLNEVKDHATLLRMLRHLLDTGLVVHLDIVGEDTLGGRIQRMAADLKVDDHVTFHGRLSTMQLVPLYQRAHLHVVSSRHEAANVATLEAAACGVPTVGTAVGYVADFAPSRAVAVALEDARALGDAIAALLNDASRRGAIGQAAGRWVMAHDVEWTAARLDEIYQGLVGGSAAVGG